MNSLTITDETGEPLLNLCLDTVKRKKQALVFCSTKNGAESQAEKIAKKMPSLEPERQNKLDALAEGILGALEQPTKQCKRLALCVKRGSAFHHAGLNSKQRDLIETAFRESTIFFICATPTLAMGMDLPAFRSIIRDVKRFSDKTSWGQNFIPVLEYEQMCGRAGRPGKETFGEAILLANTEDEADELVEKYVHGKPEAIYSKLAVEPVLRTYILSLIATGFITDRTGLRDFFSKTFYAAQYGDMKKLAQLLDKMLAFLEEEEFITVPGMSPKRAEFVDADELATTGSGRLRATPLGVRVAQLYLDPLTAAFLIKHLRTATGRKDGLPDFGLLHLLASTLEMRPLLRIKQKELDTIEAALVESEEELLVPEPDTYDYEYEEFLAAIKTTLFLLAWINETGEEALLEKYGVRPGEISAKLERADWLLYACEELSRLLAFQQYLTPLAKMRVRLEYGAKEELLNLLRLKGIGKVRARLLMKNSIRTTGDLKKMEFSSLAHLIGPKVASNLKEQVGETVDPAKIVVKTGKRKGQRSLGDF